MLIYYFLVFNSLCLKCLHFYVVKFIHLFLQGSLYVTLYLIKEDNLTNIHIVTVIFHNKSVVLL